MFKNNNNNLGLEFSLYTVDNLTAKISTNM